MSEKRNSRRLSRHTFIRRVARHTAVAGIAVAIALGLGVVGYHFLGKLNWIDSLLNASMILGGMGPVDRIESSAGKLFCSFYALFSGLFFIGVATIIVAPFVHRLLQNLNVDDSPAK